MIRVLGFACALLAANPASALEVLGPGQDNAAIEVRQRIQKALAQRASIQSIRIDKDALKLQLQSDVQSWQLLLRSPKGECPLPDCAMTGQGALWGVGNLPAEIREPVLKSLESGPPLLSWHRVVSKRPRPASTPSTLPPALQLDEALEAFRGKRWDDVISLTTVLIQDPARAPPGALSLHLSAGGEAPSSLDTMLEHYPLDSRVHALASQQARRDGDLERAARHLARALTLTPTDALAMALAKQEGWTTDAKSLGPEPDLPAEAPAWPWFLGGSMFFLLAAYALRQKTYAPLAVVVVAGLGSALIPIESSTLEQPSLLRFQLDEGQPSSCVYETAGWIHDEFRLLARCSGQNHVLQLRPKSNSDKAMVRTEHHELTLRGKGSPLLRKDVQRLADLIKQHESDGFRLTSPQTRAESILQAQDIRQEWQLRVTFGWVIAAVLVLFVALAGALRELKRAFSAFERRDKFVFSGSILLFALLQLFVGGRPIMVFEGYALTEGLAAGEIPRYGAGGLFFYGWTQWFGGTDHVSLMHLNVALGALCIALLLGWVRRLFPDDSRRLVWAAVLVLALPVLARAHGSESILVAPTAAILGALFLLSGDSSSRFILAVVLLGAAALSRPEMAVVACVIPVFNHVVRGNSGLPKLNLAWVALGLIVVVAIWSALMSATDMNARDALPATDRGIGPIIAAMTVDGILADIRCFPVALSLLGLWAITRRELRRVALASWALALVWMGLTGVDHTSASTPRTHLPIVFVMTPLLVASWTTFVDAGSRVRTGLVALLIMAGSGVSGWFLHSHNNDDAEEALWRALVTDIQDEQACIVAVGDNDPPDRGRTSRHNPEYWVANAHPGWEISPLSELENVKQRCSGKIYALLGLRCYTQMREPGEAVPEGRAMHPICADVFKEKPARNVIEWDIENRSQMSHPMYPAGSPLKIGVYELTR